VLTLRLENNGAMHGATKRRAFASTSVPRDLNRISGDSPVRHLLLGNDSVAIGGEADMARPS
jgi:hypothetical protein